MDKKKVLCLDFDGVLHSYVSEWTRPDEIKDGPVDGAVEFVNECLKHFDVVVYSARSKLEIGIQAMKDWMTKHGFPVDKIGFSAVKPYAFLTIDDNCMKFEGTFPKIESLLSHKSWVKHKREELSSEESSEEVEISEIEVTVKVKDLRNNVVILDMQQINNIRKKNIARIMPFFLNDLSDKLYLFEES